MKTLKVFSYVLGLCVLSHHVWAQEPTLPLGLDNSHNQEKRAKKLISDEPPIPVGLGGETRNKIQDKKTQSNPMPFDVSGFIEARGGLRIHDQDYEKRTSIGEARLQLQADKFWGDFHARVTSDFVADPVANQWAADFENGTGWIDLREAFLSWRASRFLDVKAGRQVLTWGTGDLIFLNDLFPKDFNATFIGRDDDYIKAPSDAIKVSLFSNITNLDFVYTPNFDADRFPNGARISGYDPFTGGQSSRNNILKTNSRASWFSEDEWAMRLYQNFGAYEAAIYGYNGYWKSPQALDIVNNRLNFTRLSAYGASLRGPFATGIGNIEFSYYDSRDDRSGNDPFIPNDQFRFLAGYEQEIASELTGTFQYNLEKTLDYTSLKRNSPAGAPLLEENRHIITARLTQLLMNQNITLSAFNFWSPNDNDGYLRSKVQYKINDQWTTELGANIFYGKNRFTAFGQFEDNSNIYLSMRNSF